MSEAAKLPVDQTASVHGLGIDVTKGRWVGVVCDDAGFGSALVDSDLGELVTQFGQRSAVVDVPIGLPNGMGRSVDRMARRLLGRRASSVFPVPARTVLEQDSYRESVAVARMRFGKGLARQTYALRDAIFEAEAVAGEIELVEGHPEVSFRAMKGAPLEYSKHSWNGMQERLALLEAEGLLIPRHLSQLDSVPTDDLLDASALAWTARRRARGLAEKLVDPLEASDRGTPIAIWY